MSAFNVEVLAKSASDGPVAMLNLVKYRNREAYAEYGKLTGSPSAGSTTANTWSVEPRTLS